MASTQWTDIEGNGVNTAGVPGGWHYVRASVASEPFKVLLRDGCWYADDGRTPLWFRPAQYTDVLTLGASPAVPPPRGEAEALLALLLAKHPDATVVSDCAPSIFGSRRALAGATYEARSNTVELRWA